MNMNEMIESFKRKGLGDADVRVILADVGSNMWRFRRAAQRRLFGEPFAYIFNKARFLGTPLYIDRRVYVPNPETEEMVRALLSEAKDGSTIVDVGCGSGAITIAVKHRLKNAIVHAVDIDPLALEVARLNAGRNDVAINVQESFYVDDLDIPAPDYVIADLPYGNSRYTLPSIDIKEFAHMPPIALFHPVGVLSAYQELIESISRKKWKTVLFFESGRVEKDEVAKIIPPGMQWEYVGKGDYSFTKIRFE